MVDLSSAKILIVRSYQSPRATLFLLRFRGLVRGVDGPFWEEMRAGWDGKLGLYALPSSCGKGLAVESGHLWNNADGQGIQKYQLPWV